MEKQYLRTKLYLDLDGVFLARTGQRTSRGLTEFQIANGAADLLRFCNENFNCYWLTARSLEGNIAEVERAFRHALSNSKASDQERVDLNTLVSDIPVAKWTKMKADAFTSEEDFYWIDDNPDHPSLSWLSQRSLDHRLVVVSTDQQPDDLTRVQAVLREIIEQSQTPPQMPKQNL